MAPTKEESPSSKQLTEKFLKLRSEALKNGLGEKQVREAIENSESTANGHDKTWWYPYWKKCQTFVSDPAHRIHVLVILLAASVGTSIVSFKLCYDYVVSTPCLVDSGVFTEEMFRPIVDCNICKDVYNVPEERNISQEEFYEKYSFTGRPVLVKGAIANWTAMDTFSFKFFKKLYRGQKGALQFIEDECQFFPYETEFLTLGDALKMPDDRANYEPGQKEWYIGWSNCHEGISKELRKHYERPYFLPKDSETVAEDWIFMGGPGLGASIHLDYVERPSWQAQISGTKTWSLVPTPECEHVCHSFNVTVHKGDIVVVDTNIWYHSTLVHPGELSITIGSEFD